MNYKKCTILTETETRTTGNTVSRPDPVTVLEEVRDEVLTELDTENAKVYLGFESRRGLGLILALAIIDDKIKELEG